MANDTAVQRQWDYPGQTLEDYLTKRLNTPGFQLPKGYSVKDGQVVRDQPAFLLRHPWLIPLLGVGTGLGVAALAKTGPFAAGTAAVGGVGLGETGAVTGLEGSGFGTGGGLGYTSVVPGVGSGVRTAVTTGLTGATALDRTVDAMKRIAPAVVPAVLGRLPGGGGGGEIPPELRDIMELQRQRMQMQQPLYQSIMRMANSRLPTAFQNAQTGAAYDTAAARDAATRRGR